MRVIFRPAERPTASGEGFSSVELHADIFQYVSKSIRQKYKKLTKPDERRNRGEQIIIALTTAVCYFYMRRIHRISRFASVT
jgi:hypothetical protein